MNKLELKTYKFPNVLVKSFQNVKTLTITQRSQYELCNASDDNPPIVKKETEFVNLHNVKIVGIQNFVFHFLCIKCSSRLKEFNGNLSKCPGCQILQAIDNCEFKAAANLCVSIDSQEQLILKAYTSSIKMILSKFEETKLAELDIFLLTKSPTIKNITYRQESHDIVNIDI